ncbi:MAG: UDP-N-acetylmuramoylalanyl-D-glutamyl-2,6-diaminopimelate--D-alanyl-D-alanine ligase [Alphaproteobacteria bacterium]|nr:UDP-N-acetylmuramoylalanyl-D-glutamyl-2,6-diaminopimelate--D-alanyl-D-alanine ligase [Alphaproteobacteria bacterium]
MTTSYLWHAEDVIRAVRGNSLQEQAWGARGVSIDSRTVEKGDLFIALAGPAHDGHDHVAAAFAAGASAAIVARQPAQVPSDAPLIFVSDTLTALQDLGRAGRARARGKIIAVTGSVGKTSSKEMLRLCLSAAGYTYANPGSFNNHWGLPLSLANLPPDADYGVFELGMNHAGELTALSRMAQPHIALITNVEAVHLEFFASVEAIADAKAEIFAGMGGNGIAVLNRDNGHYARLTAAAKQTGLKKILSFGEDGKADARLVDYAVTREGCAVNANINGSTIHYAIGAPGAHLVRNSLGVLLAATAAGADIDLCAAALARYKLPQGRGVRETIALQDGGNLTLIDESYNASPVATRAAIDVLGAITPDNGGRRLLALGDMRELGATSPALHAGLADAAVAAKIDAVYCCGDMMRYLYDALPENMRGAHAPDAATLAPIVAAAVRDGDVVTVKGSKSMHMEIVIDAIKKNDKEPHKKAS